MREERRERERKREGGRAEEREGGTNLYLGAGTDDDREGERLACREVRRRTGVAG